MKLNHVKWLAILLLGAGLLAAAIAYFITAETPKLAVAVPAGVLLIGGLSVLVFGFRYPACGSRLGLRYKNVLTMTHCPDCGTDLYEQE